jgi:4-alpha-glucanotransferase
VRPVTLVLIVHDHQPVGNFDGVIRQAYDQAYAPFLAFLESHPGFRIGLHTSGPLLQWLALHQGGYLKRLRALVDRGQVELWGGGFFEPVLPAIPEPDRRGQIQAMADWLELELGRRPRGLWLTERVWEPGLVSSLAAAGVHYTAVDDAHFVAAGFDREQLWGHALTEDQGESIAVLPIHRELRYRIPFAEPAASIDLLRGVAERGEGRLAVLGDDGEKFGVWPGTHKLCYEEGWLERFATALEANPWIELRLPGEAIAHHAPLGLAYLPSAAYHEMEEWALPPPAQARHRRAAELLAPEFGDAAHDLLRGGHWRNFLARYPESNRLHKRALRVSRLLWQQPAPSSARWRETRTRLWRAQCNCPYWHGVFGGLYLPHLRSALYRELIAAEADLGPAEPCLELGDLDLDGEVDALLEGPGWAAWVSARGARLWAFDDRRTLWNWGDTLARRAEAYHSRLGEAQVGAAEGETIHAGIRVKEAGLAALAADLDTRGRDSFLDRWIEGQGPAWDWAERRFVLAADGLVAGAVCAEGAAPALAKRFRVGEDGALWIEYTLGSERGRHGALEVDLNLALHVPRAPDRWVEVDGRRAEPGEPGARARHERVQQSAFVDGWAGRRLEVSTDRPATLERAPIETVSLSEAGAERIFQGLEARYRFTVDLEPGRPWSLRFRLAPAAAEAATGTGGRQQVSSERGAP